MKNVFSVGLRHSSPRAASWSFLHYLSAFAVALGLAVQSHSTLGAALDPADAAHSAEHHAVTTNSENEPGLLVLAPDRGFLGNEEAREAVRGASESASAQLVFVTDGRTKETLRRSLERMAAIGIHRITVVPFFLSSADPRLKMAKGFLDELTTEAGGAAPATLVMGLPFGETYFAVETLADRFRSIHSSAGRRVVVIGYGARDVESRRQMEKHWQKIADLAAEGFGFESVRALVWYDLSLPKNEVRDQELELALAEAAGGGKQLTVVPFDLGKKLDSMMSFNASLSRRLPAGAELIGGGVTPHPAISDWIGRELNRRRPVRPEDLGIVFLAHGSDYHWNETMRQAVKPLTERYKIEFAFCMAHQPIVERAVRRLEDRGARKIVIVRVFGLASSFQSSVERMIGLDVERALASSPGRVSIHEAHHSQDVLGPTDNGHHGHHHQGAGLPQPRVRSSALLTTVGGLEDDRLFAEALLDRAKALSRNPERETIVLVAHGAGEDPRNEHWRGILKSLAGQIHASGGRSFRAVLSGTWREDWPDKRAAEIAAIRRIVEEASADGGRAIVIPARTTAQGNEREFLDGLDFELGTGFAPHPLFVQWFERQIEAGVFTLRAAGLPDAHEARAALPEFNATN